MKSSQILISALDRVHAKAGLSSPEKSYWECANFSQAAKRVADEIGVDAQILVADMIFEFDNGEHVTGEVSNHEFLLIDGEVLDYTASQFSTAIDSPYKAGSASPLHRAVRIGGFLGGNDDGASFWYEAIKRELNEMARANEE